MHGDGHSRTAHYHVAKRVLDRLGSALGLLLTAPVLILCGALVWLEDRGPVMFRQVRVGQGGRRFTMLKLRTMVPGARRRGGSLTVDGDPRITRVGAALRRWKVDELPQLINVLRGEMSLVGPRPEVPEYAARYSSDQAEVLRLRPGVTDAASVLYWNEGELLARTPEPESTYVHVVMPHKIAINLAYAKQASLATDLLVGLATVLRSRALLARSGIPAELLRLPPELDCGESRDGG